MKKKLRLSNLRKTWIIDFDGTLVVHNGYKSGKDNWLPGALEFMKSIPETDYVLLLTAREKGAREKTEEFLKRSGVRYDDLKFEMPMGERILLNDDKPSGLQMAYAIGGKRNEGLEGVKIVIDETL